MYKNYNINLIYRFIALLLFLLTLLFIDNVYVLMIFFILILILNKKNNPLLFLTTIITLLFLTLKFVDNNITFINIMLIIDYIIVFIIYTKKEEFITARNILFNKRFTYKQLEKVYKKDISKENREIFDKVIDSKKDDKNISLIEDRLDSKDKSDVFDKLVINYIRFYKNQNDNYKHLGINKEVVIYLGIHLILLILAVVIK